MAGVIGTTLGLFEANAQRKVADGQRDRAIAAEKETSARADELKMVSDFQAGMLEQIDRTILQPAVITIDKQLADQPVVDAQLRQVLADRYRDLGLYDSALPLQERALATRRLRLGEEHQDTLSSINNLAALYWTTKKNLDKSIPLFEDLLKRQEAKLGRKHLDTMMTVANLGVNYKDAGRPTEAIPLLEEAYLAGKQFPETSFVAGQLIDAYVLANQPDKALAVAEEAPAKSMLGESLLGQEKYGDAEPLLLEGYNGLKVRAAQLLPISKFHLGDSIQRIVELYTATDQPDKAAEWQKKLDELKSAASAGDKPPAEKSNRP